MARELMLFQYGNALLLTTVSQYGNQGLMQIGNVGACNRGNRAQTTTFTCLQASKQAAGTKFKDKAELSNSGSRRRGERLPVICELLNRMQSRAALSVLRLYGAGFRNMKGHREITGCLNSQKANSGDHWDTQGEGQLNCSQHGETLRFTIKTGLRSTSMHQCDFLSNIQLLYQ